MFFLLDAFAPLLQWDNRTMIDFDLPHRVPAVNVSIDLLDIYDRPEIMCGFCGVALVNDWKEFLTPF